jgi:hypothetical protein
MIRTINNNNNNNNSSIIMIKLYNGDAYGILDG